jgi:serine/threonine protein phosphatase PrpC
LITVKQVQGPRPYQEDKYLIREEPDYLLLAIMDGHGGSECANYVAGRLQVLDIDPTDLRATVNQLAGEAALYDDGCTLSLVAIQKDKAYVAVLGDSPVYIYSGAEVWVAPEHNVRSNKLEARAAESRGGYIFQGYVCNRFGDGLQMSRALGDHKMAGILSTDPEVFEIPLAADSVVVVASDGVIDPGHSGPLADLGPSDSLSAETLIARAETAGLEDNATVVVWRNF